MRVLTAIVFVLSFGNVFAQIDTIRWQQLSAMPDTPRIDFAFFLVDSDYYMVGGLSSSYQTFAEVWKYNIIHDQWQQMGDFPGGEISEPTGFAINGKGYICFGIDSITGYNVDNEVWEYYPAVDSWQHKANFPSSPRAGSMAFTYGNYAYITLGTSISNYPDTWRYDPILDHWDSLGLFPRGERVQVGLIQRDSFVYLFGGLSSSSDSEYNDIWQYNINRNRWDSIGSMPGLYRDGSLLWNLGNKVVLGYGELEDSLGNNSLANDCYKYSIDSNEWDSVVCLFFLDSTCAGSGGCSFVIGKTAYFFGGYKTLSPDFTMYNNMWSFDASQFFPPDTTIKDTLGIQEVNTEVQFSVYPNPVSRDKGFSISSSENGEILFYDALGRVLDDRTLSRELNQVKLTTKNEVIFYRATLQDGVTKNGKIVMY